MVKARYSELIEEFGLPETNLWSKLNVLFLFLNCTYIKHQWGIMSVGKFTRKELEK